MSDLQPYSIHTGERPMTGPQTEIEIRLWRDEFARMRQTPEWTDAAMDAADDLLHRYRARYGQSQPTEPAPVWYDEPPFEKDGTTRPCWIAGGGNLCPADVYWSGHEWRVYVAGNSWPQQLAGRRVCPIVKPPEPTT